MQGEADRWCRRWRRTHQRIDPWNPKQPMTARTIRRGSVAVKAWCDQDRWYPIVILQHRHGEDDVSTSQMDPSLASKHPPEALEKEKDGAAGERGSSARSREEELRPRLSLD